MHFQINRPTHCKRGHEFTPENYVVDDKIKGQGSCKICRNALRRIRRAKLREIVD
jgi:hypothetical protein